MARTDATYKYNAATCHVPPACLSCHARRCIAPFTAGAACRTQDFAGRSLKVDISLPKEKGKGGKVPTRGPVD